MREKNKLLKKRNKLLIALIFLIIIIGVIFVIFKFNNNSNKDNVKINVDNEDVKVEDKSESTGKVNNKEEKEIDKNPDTEKIKEEISTETTEKKENKINNDNSNNVVEKQTQNNINQNITPVIDNQEQNTEVKSNESINKNNPWDSLGITEYDYYNKPAHSWAEVNFKISDYGSREATLNACKEYGDEYIAKHGGGYNCDGVNSYSGDYLGEYIDFY